jgi:hypothetical protein
MKRHPWVLKIAMLVHWPSIVRRVSPPLLLLGMDLVVDVQVEASFLLGIEENIFSWPGRAATVLGITMGYEILVPVIHENMLHSAPM